MMVNHGDNDWWNKNCFLQCGVLNVAPIGSDLPT